MGVREGFDPKRLDEAGWGVIFAHDADPAIEEALAPLLAMRQQQAGDRYRIYTKENGFRRTGDPSTADTKNKFLARQGMWPGPANPDRVPYYLLIVGSPAAIPFKFQQELDVQYAVGRIDFATPDEYRYYAESVVAAERLPAIQQKKITFFGPEHPDDPYTALLSQSFVRPLAAILKNLVPEGVAQVIGSAATKAALSDLLRDSAAQRLFIAAGHSMTFAPGDPRQQKHQGALLCADWPGPQRWDGRIPPDYYFAGEDFAAYANLHGLVACFFASYSVGSPEHEDFARQALKAQLPLAPFAFSAELPRRMLSHPNGGALAVIGYVDHAIGLSHIQREITGSLSAFEYTFQRLLSGYPIGAALDHMSERYAEIAIMLSNELEDIKFGKNYDPYDLTDLWMATNNVRSLTVFGDPAVRLPVS